MKITHQTLELVAFAAYQSHNKVINKVDENKSRELWEVPSGPRALWMGMVKGILINLEEAQKRGFVQFNPDATVTGDTPAMVDTAEVRAAMAAALPGLGAPLPGRGAPPPSPAARLGRDLAAKIREGQRPAIEVPGATRPEDVPPGLAIDRGCIDCGD